MIYKNISKCIKIFKNIKKYIKIYKQSSAEYGKYIFITSYIRSVNLFPTISPSVLNNFSQNVYI